ncbi:aldo/keto reductase [Parvularcula sp. IMCC14364]|uniref:aldo/keto reductase n=1 Tax=Parvularcula sp. IMCC14364 TaxID=3067902 RepID=UPI0027428158|nr:aldo/keto reductase [Parvularcula sp. IMCC14364]
MSDISRLGFGCSGPWGMKWFSEQRAIALVHSALEAGITQFDTGSFYCDGEAERRLGLALSHLPTEQKTALQISSKTGTKKGTDGRLEKDFSEANIRHDVSTSLRKIGIARLDTLYLHGPDDTSLHQALPVLKALKKDGTIGNIGICGEGRGLQTAADTPEVDVIMGSFNILTRQHSDIFRQARSREKRVVSIAPLAQGLYRRGFFSPSSLPDLWYLARAAVKNRSELRRARNLRWLHDVDGWQASELALRFVLEQDHIDTAMMTTTRLAHLNLNIRAASRSLPDHLTERLNDIQ